jgi:hypothetical protein
MRGIAEGQTVLSWPRFYFSPADVVTHRNGDMGHRVVRIAIGF